MTNAEEIRQREAIMLEVHGWYAHCVPSGDKTTPTGFNYHTHGFEKSYGHKDIQIVLPINPKVAHELIIAILSKIKSGVRFEVDIEYTGIMKNDYKVRFIAAKEYSRDVLRLLIPDKDGEFKGMYAKQFKGLDKPK